MYKCYKCKEEKNDCEFHKDKSSKHGLSYECKKCKSKFRKLQRQKNPEHYKQQQKRNLEKNLKNIRKSQRQHWEKNKEKINERRKKYREVTGRSFQDKARTLTHYAIRLGYLTRSSNCEKCMKVCKPEAHHEDYYKPLEVQWLCKICRNHKHKKMLDLTA